MSTTIREEAFAIRKLIREAEAVSDEVMIACARLKQAMVRARQNPDIAIDAGQRALIRLNQAEGQALALSTSLLRVHDELSKVSRETLGGEEGVDTVVSASTIAEEVPALHAA